MLVTGAGGMVGREVLTAAATRGWQAIGRNRAELDITDRRAVRATVSSSAVDLVLNAAAYTHVDEAEDDADAARRVNADGPAWLAESCDAAGVPLVHLSTDYVFDGRGGRPYRPQDSPNPLSIYGRTKWQGEEAVRSGLARHVIVRTAWVYAPHGRNFLCTIARLAREQEILRVVADQHGSPTLAADLASALLDAATLLVGRDDAWGTYHFCNGGETTWYGFASAIVAGLGSRPGVVCRSVVPITTSERPTRAVRPAYSVLDTTAWIDTFGAAPRSWEAALAEALCRLS